MKASEAAKSIQKKTILFCIDVENLLGERFHGEIEKLDALYAYRVSMYLKDSGDAKRTRIGQETSEVPFLTKCFLKTTAFEEVLDWIQEKWQHLGIKSVTMIGADFAIKNWTTPRSGKHSEVKGNVN